VEQAVTNDLDANKSLVRSFVAAWNDREFDRFDTLMGDDAVLNVGGATVSCSPEGTRAIAREWTTAFPDWRFDLRTVIAEGDLVVAHVPYRGTFTGPIVGVAPTGRSAYVDEIVIFQVEDGKVAQAWEVYDECGMWRQLGVGTPP
jgi:steroid delta-isomerase-like uncharacterized protein